MKLITLNTWGGRAGRAELLDFFSHYRSQVDIFCLQEVWAAPYEHLEGASAGGRTLEHDRIMVRGKQEISELLMGHAPFFRPHYGDNYGLLTFVDKSLDVVEEGELFVYKDRGFVPVTDIGNHARNIQYVTFNLQSRPVTVINFHGLWNGQGKTDSADRIVQSRNILAFTQTLTGDYILCGDFNLLPSTESIALFERAGLRNLIREYGITSTRTSHYAKPERHADYVFVTPGIEVRDFRVLHEEVSDHAALMLDFA